MTGFNTATLDALNGAIEGLENYYAEIRAMFDFIETRFKIPEYGCALESIEQHDLFSNASGFKLSDDSDYPYYLWVPSWLGRFYVSRPGKKKSADPLSFIWVWSGSGDAYVQDTFDPECWIGVTAPEDAGGRRPVGRIATTIFQQFRLERNGTDTDTDADGWINGRFHANDIGCDITGAWSIQRVPLRDLQTYYQIEKRVIRPLAEKHHAAESSKLMAIAS